MRGVRDATGMYASSKDVTLLVRRKGEQVFDLLTGVVGDGDDGEGSAGDGSDGWGRQR